LSQKFNIKRSIFSTVYKNLTYNLQQIRYTAQKVDEVYGLYVNFESRMCCLYNLAYVYIFD